jgi:hypothetical protein
MKTVIVIREFELNLSLNHNNIFHIAYYVQIFQ